MRILVTGGGGFLGSAIVRRLLARRDQVRSFSRSEHPTLDSDVEQIQGSLADSDAVSRVVAGCDAVMHVAAKAGVWGPRSEYEATNVIGTRNVIAACRRHGVRKLVFTSTPSVVGAGFDIEGSDESLPYATQHLADYPRTKAIAEREILAANGPDLATVALRPHLIWGPGDNHLIPRILARARAGRLKIVGSGKNRVDVTYVSNAADAHLLALEKLAIGSPVAGRVFFISDGEPVELWLFVNRILKSAGLPPVTQRVPYRVAYAAGALLEASYRLFHRTSEPPMTRFVAAQLAHSHWFDISAAMRDLSYHPQVDIDDGLRTVFD